MTFILSPAQLLISASLLFLSFMTSANEVRIAVASNFLATLKTLSQHFEQTSGHKVILISGSTGKLFTQIKQGAPFDVFLAADTKHPSLLEKQGHAINGSRFTYATGKIVLWSAVNGYINNKASVLKQANFRFLAIANPEFAPYGIAAREIMLSLGVWQHLQKKLVRGENVTQAFQYVKTGNAKLGFIAFSQIKQAPFHATGSYWDIPQHYYTPIRQQAVLLTETTAAREFLRFIQTPAALKIMHASGYIITDDH